MDQAPIDVVGIGNAIVDVIAHADEAFLENEALVKGTMALIDAERAETLYQIMGPAIEASGGSAAQHDGRHRLARRPAAPISAKCAMTCWARCFATI